MYYEDLYDDSGEENDSPKVFWDNADRYAIIAFLLLSVDGKMSDDDLKKLDAFIGTDEVEAEDIDECPRYGLFRKRAYKPAPKKTTACRSFNNMEELPSTKDVIIREGGAFLDSLDPEERDDCIIDEIDRVIKGSKKCGIGDGYDSEGDALPGTAYTIFNFIKWMYPGKGCSKNQKRILKHLARKWDVDKSLLPVLENSVKLLDEIDRKRVEIKDSDMPHREAVSALAELNAREKAVQEELIELLEEDDENVVGAIGGGIAGAMYSAALLSESTEAEIEAQRSLYGDGVIDEIGDCIVEGIHKVGDIICAPFGWMTEKIMDWT